ncbi:MAG TPA: hypothetical protein VIH93_08665, partial [Thermoanaerobaculia bacterium]
MPPAPMKRSRSPRDVWASLLPTAGAALALAAAVWVPALARGGRPSAGLLVVALLAAAAAAGHRPLGGATLGLGTVALPAMLALASPLAAALLATAAVLAAELVHRQVRVSSDDQVAERRRQPLRAVESCGRVALATLAAGAVWVVLAARRQGMGLPALVLAAAAVYLVLFVGLEIADRKIRRPDVALELGVVLRPLSLDAFGWAAGSAIAVAGLAAGWRTGGLLLACFGVLAAEAARTEILSDLHRRRAEGLERVGRAAETIGGSGREIVAVAEQIRDECRNVLPFHWFQLELLAPGRGHQSWWSG